MFTLALVCKKALCFVCVRVLRFTVCYGTIDVVLSGQKKERLLALVVVLSTSFSLVHHVTFERRKRFGVCRQQWHFVRSTLWSAFSVSVFEWTRGRTTMFFQLLFSIAKRRFSRARARAGAGASSTAFRIGL